ncbi:Uncharacterised protein [Mobiluncus curtisii]|uniref:Uncharacterized protein n=1 Tax=Mobiluncus curtisii TaxID=2051 RepID=A0A2X3BK99_9ACTO|nr:Uncharacterised protein [Mobiluncus curtisii]
MVYIQDSLFGKNVPGAFSSNKGADFHSVLQNLISVVDETAAADLPRVQKWHKAGAIVADQWSIAWRVLDAQFFRSTPTTQKNLPYLRFCKRACRTNTL